MICKNKKAKYWNRVHLVVDNRNNAIFEIIFAQNIIEDIEIIFIVKYTCIAKI